MEFIVENDRATTSVGPDATSVGPDATSVGPDATSVGPDATSVGVELGTDLTRHTLAELRAALGVPVAPGDHEISLADVGLHRGMVFGHDTAETRPTSLHLSVGWRPDVHGRFPVIRPPHVAAPRPKRPRPLEPPPPLDALPALPYSTVIPMLVVSALMAVVWSPTFAMLGAASAAIPLVRAVGPRFTRKRSQRRHAQELAAHASALAADLEAWDASMADWLEHLVSSPGEIDRLVGTARLRPWTRRLPNGASLPLAVGRGALDVVGDGVARRLDDVPLVVEIERGLAVTGDRADVVAIARWIGIETAYRYGPADLDLTILTTLDRRPDWEWVRWMPGRRRVEIEARRIDDACDDATVDDAHHLVFVDGPVPAGPGGFARLLGGHLESARVIWLGACDDVPAVCERELVATADGFVRSADGHAAGWAWRLGADEAEEFARFLAPFVDPEVEERSATLPDAVPLARLCPLASGHAGAAELREVWERARPDELRIPLGVTSEGPLVLDFVSDGPHALVAGTTGSGKSELLRSMVVGAAATYAPGQLAFVLIDFKGGGAFDAVARLPHVAAVVTDLEPAQAMRALRSLRAELQYREHVLRAAGVSDLAQLAAGPSTPPRLMVVVDEFAALADELPTFLEGLVDVARRGRSLGVHLVLATQRPAGVVTNEIRANTNLRICLRVRDAGDSVDVIDRPDASSLPPFPGRAIVSIGGERHRVVQVGYLAGARLLTASPFTLASVDESSEPDTWLTDAIDVIVASHPERVRAPWLRAIPTQIVADDLWAIGDRPAGGPDGRSILGALDDADRREQKPIFWSPADGGLVVAGADPDRVAATIVTVVAALALDDPDLDVLVLDGSGGLVDRLDLLGSVADVILHRDAERLSRALTMIDRRRRSVRGVAAPAMVVVVNRWRPVVDALADVVGPDAPLQLARAFADGAIVPIIGVTSDGELPSRLLTVVRRRLVHALGEANSGLALGVLGPNMPAGGAAVYDVEARLPGVIADLSDHGLDRLAAWSRPTTPPAPVRVLSDCMPIDTLPDGTADADGWLVPIAFDEDLEPVAVRLSPRRRFVILGRPGSGRTTAIAAVTAGLDRLGATADVEIIDDADHLAADDVGRRLEAADAADRPVVVAVSTSSVRAFGSWVGPLLQESTVLMLTPSRHDAEVVRVVVPDLSLHPTGRSILLDRRRVTVVHVAIDPAA